MNRFKLSGGHLRAALFLALAGAAAAGYWHDAQSVERLQAAAENLAHCRQLAARIADVARSPRRARLESRSLDDLGTTVEKAAAAAQLARDRILRIDPQAARRLGKSDYLDQSTEVELLAVTLRQVVDFLFHVTRADDQLQVTTLRLRTPHDEADSGRAELWLADIVLTQRIYAPTK